MVTVCIVGASGTLGRYMARARALDRGDEVVGR
jgi:NAD(P)-dependent dehydrogenase (short-subunit alcohol dehydrogenase family)